MKVLQALLDEFSTSRSRAFRQALPSSEAVKEFLKLAISDL
jgi:hypothetical protein